MKFVRRAILFVLCLPFNLVVGWPVVLFVRACWGTNLRWEIAPTSGGLPALTCELRDDSWLARTWGRAWAGTTLGHAIVYGQDVRVTGEWRPVQAHEHIHVEQYEGAMAAHALLGALAGSGAGVGGIAPALSIGLGIWFLGYLVFLLGGWLAALLRGESVYRGSAHEEAARAETADPDA